MNRSGPTIRARVIRVLRTTTAPLSTAQLARRCAVGNPRASAVTFTVLRALERARVVVRFAPVIQGRGRPACRWLLSATCAQESRAA